VKHWFEPGGYYHITTRTLDKKAAFASDESKQCIVDAIAFYRRRGDWRVGGFAVMINHIHLVVSQTGPDLRDTVRDFKKWVFRRLKGPGAEPLWERRFDDNAIQHEAEMLEVIQYIHCNPVRAGVVGRPEDYFWSSARNYAGLTPVAMEVDKEW